MSASVPKEAVTLFQKSYWDRPPPREKGDADANMVFQAVGRALTLWEMTDQALADIFLVMTASRSAESFTSVRRAYGSIRGNAGRREAVTAAAEVYFSPHYEENKEVRKSVTDIINAVSWASRLRDDIAHGATTGMKIDNVDYGFFLVPPEYNTDRTHAFIQDNAPLGILRAKYRYTSEDITNIAGRFRNLHFHLLHYPAQIAKRDGIIPLVDAILAKAAPAKKAQS